MTRILFSRLENKHKIGHNINFSFPISFWLRSRIVVDEDTKKWNITKVSQWLSQRVELQLAGGLPRGPHLQLVAEQLRGGGERPVARAAARGLGGADQGPGGRAQLAAGRRGRGARQRWVADMAAMGD